MKNAVITLLRAASPRALAALLFLTVVLALTEGIGLLMLVPMLSLLSDGQMTESLPAYSARIVGSIAKTLGLSGILVLFVMLIASRGALRYRLSLLSMRIEHEIIDRFRYTIHRALLKANWRHLSGMRQSDNANLLIKMVEDIGAAFSFLVMGITSAATLGVVWLTAFALSPVVAAIAAVGGGLVVFLLARLRRKSRGLGKILVARYDQLQAEAQEGLGALRLIKTHGREDAAATRLRQEVEGLRAAQFETRRLTLFISLLLNIGGAVVLALVVLVASGRGTPLAVLLPMIVLFSRSVPLFASLQRSINFLAFHTPTIERAQSVIAMAEAEAEPVGDAAVTPPVREIAARKISVRYEGRSHAALIDVSLALPVGSMTALTGPSGAGKSTLADIFGGLLEGDDGALTLDGRNLANAERIGWRRHVAYLHQEPILFHATIRENLQWGDPGADDDALERALQRASAGFVMALPDGLDTVVGDAGRRLSGGERQRIALARALLGDPALLILDEATSALDAGNDAAVAEAVARLKGSCTILVIGHRGALTEMADTVMVMEAGQIKGQITSLRAPNPTTA